MKKVTYTRKFFDNQADASIRSAKQVLPIVIDHFKPRSLIDVGCGVGGWAAVAMELGVERVIGVDGDYVSPDQLRIPPTQFIACDLAKEDVKLDERFDLACSLEVAEHLPEHRARPFVAALTRLADVVLFSAAIPGQGGKHHVNEQWQSYWVRLFNELGYGAQDIIRPKIWGNKSVRSWYKQNCIVFVRGKTNDRSLEHYDIVHPDRYLTRITKLTEKARSARKSSALASRTQHNQLEHEPQFCFCIPFKSKQRSRDWNATQSLLGHTLRSILRQTDPNFRVVIAGHDRPDIPELEDARVEFIAAQIPLPKNGEEGKKDQIAKMHIAAGYASRYGSTYIMVVDSDDLIDKRIVEFVRRDRHPVGYMVRAGYVYDTRAGLVGEFPSASDPAQLWQHCGTCAIFYFDQSELPEYKDGNVTSTKSFFQRLKGHRRWESKMMAAGRFPATLPFRGVLYRLNTGDNASYDYRRNDAFIEQLLTPTRASSVRIDDIADNFGL